MADISTNIVAASYAAISGNLFPWRTKRRLDSMSDGTLLYLHAMRGTLDLYQSTDQGASWSTVTDFTLYTNTSIFFEPTPSLWVDNADNLHICTIRGWKGNVSGNAYYDLYIYVGTINDGAWTQTSRRLDWSLVPGSGRARVRICDLTGFTLNGTIYSVIATARDDDRIHIAAYRSGDLSGSKSWDLHPGTGSPVDDAEACSIAFKHIGDGKTPTSTPDLAVLVHESADDIHYGVLDWSATDGTWETVYGSSFTYYNTDNVAEDNYLHSQTLGYDAEDDQWIYICHKLYKPVALVGGGSSAMVAYQGNADSTASNYMVPTWDHHNRTIHVITEDSDGTGIRTQQFDIANLSWSDGDDHPTAPTTEGDGWYAARVAGSWGDYPKLDAVYYDGTNIVYTDEWNLIFNRFPLAPTWNMVSSQAFDINEALTLTWTFVDPDPGDTQTAYRLRRQKAVTPTSTGWEWWDGTTWQTTEQTVTSTTSTVTIPSGWGADTDDPHHYSVATKDAEDWSEYNTPLIVIADTREALTITGPAAQADVDATATVTWAVAEQSAWRLRVMHETVDTVYYDSGRIIDATTRSHIAPFAPHGVTRRVEVQTWSATGLASVPATITVNVVYVPPDTSTITVAAEPDEGRVRVTSTSPTPTGGQPDPTVNDLYRRRAGQLGTGIRVKAGAAPGDTVDDYTVRSGVGYEYLIRTHAVNGTHTDTAWTV